MRRRRRRSKLKRRKEKEEYLSTFNLLLNDNSVLCFIIYFLAMEFWIHGMRHLTKYLPKFPPLSLFFSSLLPSHTLFLLLLPSHTLFMGSTNAKRQAVQADKDGKYCS
jgi:hypothetical protein